MEHLTRRQLGLGVMAMVAADRCGVASGQAAGGGGKPTAEEAVLGHAAAFPFDGLPVVKGANGETRKVLQGVLTTGELVEVHETLLLAGHMPHVAHQHRHSEFMLVREGTLEFDNDGTPQRVGAGDVMFAASGMMHGLKNVGDGVAQYFVVAIGRETAQAGEGTIEEKSGLLRGSRVFAMEKMPARELAGGGESRDFVRGSLATGEVVGLHASRQPAGAVAGPMHVIQHSELVMVRAGTVGFEHDGKVDRLGPGGVGFVAVGTKHAVRNVGEGAAEYFVLGIGGDVKGS